jgi:16S rRNA (cytosine967-C5)-methyltransferase
MTPPSAARTVAARVLERVLSEGAYAELALDGELDRRQLSPRVIALATELVYGTLRWQRYLDWILAPHSKRRLDGLDPGPLVLLRMTAYQIAFLERVPAFAAVNDAVTLAGRARKPGVGGFVNAVLRSFARRGAAEREPRAPADLVEALALRCSFPSWVAARWMERYGASDAEKLMRALNERPSLTLRTNTLRVTREALAARLETEEKIGTRPTRYASEGLVAEHGGRPGNWRAFADGAFAIQDEASMLVTQLLEAQPGDTVGDVCAAPGTKTTHLAQLMENRGRILAFDPQPARLNLVREAAARLGVTIVQTLDGPAETLAPKFPGACDAVLVDAPCSSLGVLRRNPEVKWRRAPGDIVANAGRQQMILNAAATMVKPGGRLVYATCSLEPEENDEVARGLMAAHPDFALDPPSEFPLPVSPDGFLRLLPHHHGTDGFTAVRLIRCGR